MQGEITIQVIGEDMSLIAFRKSRVSHDRVIQPYMKLKNILGRSFGVEALLSRSQRVCL
jgi:hypothetical protein